MTTVTRGGIDWPWSIMSNRRLQLEWWRKYGTDVLRTVGPMKPSVEEVVVARPPDEMKYAGEERLGHGGSIVRRHTIFKTWPVRVVNETVADLLGLFWVLPDGQKIALKIRVNERTYTHEEEVAGA